MIVEKIKEALTVLPSKSIAIAYLISLAFDSYNNNWAMPELFPAIVGFTLIVAIAFILMEQIMGLTGNPYADVVLLGAVSYLLAGAVQVFFNIIQIDVLDINQIAFAGVFGAVAAGVMYGTRKWNMS